MLCVCTLRAERIRIRGHTILLVEKIGANLIVCIRVCCWLGTDDGSSRNACTRGKWEIWKNNVRKYAT